MSRLAAFGIHFTISLAIFIVLAYLVLAHWYPGLFFDTDGGWQGIRIIVAVDLVLGPLLTLVVFKAGKPGLKFDLTMIGLVQAVCLAAGVWIVFSERPVAMVYVDKHFYSMNADTYTELNLLVPDLSNLPGDAPKWITVVLPEDPVENADLRGEKLRARIPLRALTNRYQPWVADAKFLAESYASAGLLKRDEGRGAIPKWLAKHGGTLGDYRFYPFGARYDYSFLAFSKATGEIVGVLDVPAPYTAFD